MHRAAASMTPARLQQTDANALSVDDGPEPAAERSVHIPIDTGPLAAEDEDTVSTTPVSVNVVVG